MSAGLGTGHRSDNIVSFFSLRVSFPEAQGPSPFSVAVSCSVIFIYLSLVHCAESAIT